MVSAVTGNFREWFEVGNAALGRADLKAAETAFQHCTEIDANNADAWCYLGMSLTPKEQDRAILALERALSLSPNHHGALYWSAEAHWISGDPAKAAEYLARLNDVAPGAPQNLSRLGLALLDAGDLESGHRALRRAVNAGGGLADARAHAPELRRAIYLDLLGLHEKADELISEVNSSGPKLPLPADRYPRDLEDLRCTLENAVAGRDIVIMGSGPSLGDLPPLLEKLGKKGCDQLCFLGFNNVPVAEKMLMDCIGRGVDLACMSSAAVMDLHSNWIKQFLDRDEPSNLFIIPSDARPTDQSLVEKLSVRKNRLCHFVASGDYPPIPGDPLHFPPINTLICALPMAALSQPRRIFLFGCDGAAPNAISGQAPVYFREGSAEYGNQPLPTQLQYARWLARDTFFFNALIHTVMKSLSVLHRLQLPPVFICNPESAYRPFPRISTGEFLHMMSNPPATSEYYPARISQLQRRLDSLQSRVDGINGGNTGKPQLSEKSTAKIPWLRYQLSRVKRFLRRRLSAAGKKS